MYAVRDYGFDLPDVRASWALTDGSRLELIIIRDYREPKNDWEDENDLNFDVSFKLVSVAEDDYVKQHLMTFPEGVGQGACEKAVWALYAHQIDDKATKQLRRDIAEDQRAERLGL